VAAALPPLSHVAGPAAHATREAPRASAASAVSPAASRADEGAEGRIYAISELPEDVRRALPRLSVGGSIYSDNPAGRFVIINGQVFHENDRLAPDLTLEQIRLKLAVLRYKDVRFRIMF
jgi:general secretion pathway protein B